MGYNAPVSGNITFLDADFQFTVPGFSKTGFVMRQPGGFVRGRTALTDFSVKVGGNWSGFGSQSQVFLFVDGVFNQAISLTADNTTQTVAIATLPAGVKIITLMNGYAAQSDFAGSINRPQAAVSVQGIVTTGDFEIEIPPAVDVKIKLLSMSIGTGAGATYPTVTGWFWQGRNSGRKLQGDVYGARGLATNSGTFNSTLAADMATYLCQDMNGTLQNILIIDLGTNDFWLTGWRFSAAVWGAHYALLLDALATAMPSLVIVCLTPLNRTDYNTTNSGGATLVDYTNQIHTQAAGRPNVHVIDGKDFTTLAKMPDGLHPNQAGHDDISTNFWAAFDALNLAAVPNLFADVPACVVAKSSIDFATAGLDATNTRIIYEVGSPLKSWDPTRTINPLTGLTADKGYYIIPAATMDKSTIFAPPL